MPGKRAIGLEKDMPVAIQGSLTTPTAIFQTLSAVMKRVWILPGKQAIRLEKEMPIAILGSHTYSPSDFQKAIERFEESLNIAREAGDWAGISRANQYLRISYFALPKAIASFPCSATCSKLCYSL